ncbi:alpha/beta fold hydrolase [Myxococcus landrumensis]|uniref:Alpha/beta hydrolase n=1 Tax=Myxococcus landrumensis TaxID=2813577 RepID=A0ABX7N1E5_9BACT|nr:alpha/beta hydrolase [Myxococcus landrumus]QSQ12321.1 alpha/beta hydrolase [Myxococcus landrumus]
MSANQRWGGAVLLVACLSFLACASKGGVRADAPWTDPSPHREGAVTVEPGVSLEYLDWGGTGPVVVLLAGQGNTAHIFDDFAPLLTREFRVVALTRRGFGKSSKPESGYDVKTRVEDVRRALDELKLDKVSLVGHSLAGDELTAFAALHPQRVHKLVYLEAAYDHTRMDALVEGAPTPSGPSDEERSSPQAFTAWQSRMHGFEIPEAEVRTGNVFDARGQWTADVTPGFVYERLAQGNATPDYASVMAPVLAYYVVEEAVDVVFPWTKAMTPSEQEQISKVLRKLQTFGAAEQKRLTQALPTARVVGVREANHYFFLTHSDTVVPELSAFLRAP